MACSRIARFAAAVVLAQLLLLPAAAEAQGGTITGKVEATPAKYLKDTVVYVQEAPGATAAPKTEKMDQQHMAFIPHVLDVTQGDTVKFENHDKVAHNVFSPDIEPYNLGTFPPDQSKTHTFTKPGAYTQLCSLHPEMLGYVYVAPTPYHAKLNAQGEYTIKDVPAGTYQLAIWNAKLKAPAQSVTVEAGQKAEANFSLQR